MKFDHYYFILEINEIMESILSVDTNSQSQLYKSANFGSQLAIEDAALSFSLITRRVEGSETWSGC